MPDLYIRASAFFALVIIHVSLALAYKAAQSSSGSYPFHPSALLVLSEILKLFLSAGLLYRGRPHAGRMQPNCGNHYKVLVSIERSSRAVQCLMRAFFLSAEGTCHNLEKGWTTLSRTPFYS